MDDILDFNLNDYITPSSMKIDEGTSALKSDNTKSDIEGIESIANFVSPIRGESKTPFIGDMKDTLDKGEVVTNYGLEDVEKRRAEGQSWLEQLGNAIVQGLVGVAGIGALQGFADLYDIFTGAIFGDLGKDIGENEKSTYMYRNPVSEWLQEKHEELNAAFPIYSDKEYNIGNGGLAHWSWYMQNFPSIFSFISFAIPSSAATKGITTIGRLATKSLNAGKAINKASKLGRASEVAEAVSDVGRASRIGNVEKAVATAAEKAEVGIFEGLNPSAALDANRLTQIKEYTKVGINATLGTMMANQMFARDVAKAQYDQFMQDYADDKVYAQFIKDNPEYAEYDKDTVARMIANRAARTDWEWNIITGIPMFSQFYSMRNIWKGIPSRAGSMKVRQTAREIGENFGKTEAEIAKKNAAKSFWQRRADNFKDMDFSFGSAYRGYFDAGWGNAVNVIAEEEGKYDSGLLLGKEHINGGVRFSNYMTDGHLWDAAIWGVIGGMFSNVVGSAFGAAKEKYNRRKIGKEYLSEEDTRINQLRMTSSNFEAYSKAMELINDNKDIFHPQINEKGKEMKDDQGGTLYKSFKNDSEKEYAKKKAFEAFVVEEIIAASNVGNLDFIKSLFDNPNVQKAFVDAGFVTQEDASLVSNEFRRLVKEVESSYNRHINHIVKLGIDPYLARIIATDNARAEMNIKAIDSDLTVTNNRIQEELNRLGDLAKDIDVRKGSIAVVVDELKKINNVINKINSKSKKTRKDVALLERNRRAKEAIEEYVASKEFSDIERNFIGINSRYTFKYNNGEIEMDDQNKPVIDIKNAQDYKNEITKDYSESQLRGFENDITQLASKSAISKLKSGIVSKELQDLIDTNEMLNLNKVIVQKLINASDEQIFGRAEEVRLQVIDDAKKALANANTKITEMMKKYDPDEVFEYVNTRGEESIKNITEEDKKELDDAIKIMELDKFGHEELIETIDQDIDVARFQTIVEQAEAKKAAEAAKNNNKSDAAKKREEDERKWYPYSADAADKKNVEGFSRFERGDRVIGLNGEKGTVIGFGRDKSGKQFMMVVPDNSNFNKTSERQYDEVRENVSKMDITDLYDETLKLLGVKPLTFESSPIYADIVNEVTSEEKEDKSVRRNIVNRIINLKNRYDSKSIDAKEKESIRQELIDTYISLSYDSDKNVHDIEVERKKEGKDFYIKLYSSDLAFLSFTDKSKSKIKTKTYKKGDVINALDIEGYSIKGTIVDEETIDGRLYYHVAENMDDYNKDKSDYIIVPAETIKDSSTGEQKKAPADEAKKDEENKEKKEKKKEKKNISEADELDEGASIISPADRAVLNDIAEAIENVAPGKMITDLTDDERKKVREYLKDNSYGENDFSEDEYITAVDEFMDTLKVMPLHSTALDLLYLDPHSSPLERIIDGKTVRGFVSESYLRALKNFLDEYCNARGIKSYAELNNMSVDANHPANIRFVQVLDMLRYMKEQNFSNRQINSLYTTFVQYLIAYSNKPGCNFAIDTANASAITSMDIYNALNESEEETVRREMNPLQKINLHDIIVSASQEGRKSEVIKILNKINVGDKLIVKTGDGGINISIEKDGEELHLGALPIPKLVTSGPDAGAFKMTNDGWITDIKRDGRDVSSRFIDFLFASFIDVESEFYSQLMDYCYNQDSAHSNDESYIGQYASNPFVQNFDETDFYKKAVELGFVDPKATNYQLVEGLKKLFMYHNDLSGHKVRQWGEKLLTSYELVSALAMDSENYDVIVNNVTNGLLMYDKPGSEGGRPSERLNGTNYDVTNPDAYKIGVTIQDNTIDIAGEIVPDYMPWATIGRTFVAIPNRGSKTRDYAHAYPCNVHTDFIGREAKEIVKAIKDRLYDLIVAKINDSSSSTESFEELADFLSSVFRNKNNRNSLFRISRKVRNQETVFVTDTVDYEEGEISEQSTYGKSQALRVTRDNNRIVLGAGPGKYIMLYNFNDTVEGEQVKSNIVYINEKEIGITDELNNVSELRDEIDSLFDNIDFDITFDYLKSDTSPNITFGENSIVHRTEDGKFAITVGDKTWTFNSYNEFILGQELCTVTVNKNGDNGNFQLEHDIVKAQQTMSFQVIKKDSVKPEEKTLADSNVVNEVKDILSKRGVHAKKATEVVRKLLGDAFKELESDELQIYPDRIHYDNNVMKTLKAEDSNAVVLPNDKTINGTKYPKGTVFIGDKFFEGMNKSIEDNNINAYNYAKKVAALKLIHEKLHILLTDDANRAAVQNIRSVYEEFAKSLADPKNQPILEQIAARTSNPDEQSPRELMEFFLFNDNLHKTEESKLEEFLIESLTNKRLINYLNNVETSYESSSTGESLWSKLMKFLMQLIGVDINKKSLYEREFNILSDLYSEKNTNFAEEKSNEDYSYKVDDYDTDVAFSTAEDYAPGNTLGHLISTSSHEVRDNIKKAIDNGYINFKCSF